jgi:alpha-ribazole phosphatase
MKVVLIRHLQPQVEPGTCYGRLDLPLSPEGKAQIPRMLEHPGLRGVARIWSSPARRCHAVAEPISALLGVAVTYDARLTERDFGDWEGMPWSKIDRNELDRWAAAPTSFRPPNGESGEALAARVRAFHREIEERGESAVVIAHGGPLRVLSALLRRDAIDLLAPPPALGAIDVIRVSLPATNELAERPR